MQLEEDLLFQHHGPKLKVHWMALKDSSILEIPDFPSCNDEYFNQVGHSHVKTAMLKSNVNVISVVPDESQLLPTSQGKRSIKEKEMCPPCNTLIFSLGTQINLIRFVIGSIRF